MVGTQWPDLWPFVLHSARPRESQPGSGMHNGATARPQLQAPSARHAQATFHCWRKSESRQMQPSPWPPVHGMSAIPFPLDDRPSVWHSCGRRPCLIRFAASRRLLLCGVEARSTTSWNSTSSAPAFESMPFQGTMPATRLTVRVWRASREGICPRCSQNNFKAKWLRFPPRPAALPAARHCSPSYAQDKGGFVSRWRRPMPSRSNMANARSIS